MMKTPLVRAHSQPRYGILPRHWSAILRYVQSREVFLFVRGGKEGALPWIEEGFPGKPIELKIKVEPRTGLLWAQSDKDRKSVFEAGHLVLSKSDSGIDAVDERGKVATPQAYKVPADWIAPGVVVDRKSGLPFTSDYDLAAVIHRKEFDYIRDVAGFTLGKSQTSHLAEQTRSDLNALFGSERVRHGPQAMYDQKLSNDGESAETIIAFCPNGEAYEFKTPQSEAAATMQFRDLLMALHPAKKHVFMN